MRTSKLFLFTFGILAALMAVSFTASPIQRYGPDVIAVVDMAPVMMPIIAEAPHVAVAEERLSSVAPFDGHTRRYVVWNQPGQAWRAAAGLGFAVIDPHIRVS
jgi:hypothetical protein